MTRTHASVLGPLDPGSASLLRLLDGTRGLPLLYAEGGRNGLSPADVNRLLHTLANSGLLEDATGGGEAAHAVRQDAELMDRLRPDLASLALLDRRPAGAVEALAARAGARVLVRGAGRVGAAVAALLSAAGVGAVEVMDGGRVEPADVSPAGLPPSAVGSRRAEAARRLVSESAPSGRRRSRPDAREGRLGEVPPPDLVVLAPRDAVSVHAPDPEQAEPLLAAGVPHLYAGVVETTGLVGPLVLPGRTGCAGCLERHRVEREAGHARLLAQWRSGRAHRVEPVDLALATTVAALAAGHALSFLDGHLPTTTGERWETTLPSLSWARHQLPAHRDCPCGAAGPSGWEPAQPPPGDTTTVPASGAGRTEAGRPAEPATANSPAPVASGTGPHAAVTPATSGPRLKPRARSAPGSPTRRTRMTGPRTQGVPVHVP
jgi:bacteriocin biosynthesis cyclodehydratase domain-containing protein